MREVEGGVRGAVLDRSEKSMFSADTIIPGNFVPVAAVSVIV